MDQTFVPPRRKGSIRILAFSDWRVQNYEDLLHFIERVPTCDIVVYAGDDLDRLISAQEIIRQVVEMTTAGQLLFVAGNDDTPEDRELLGKLPFIHNLHLEPFKFGNFVFVGLEGTTDGMGFIQHSERQVKEHLNENLLSVRRRNGWKGLLPVIISHAPPHGVLDMAMRHSLLPRARAIGSASLRDFLDKHKVPLTVCGHVHLCGGREAELQNNNLVVNIASHDDRGADGRLAVIDLKRSGRAEVNFFTTTDLLHQHELSRLHHVGVSRVRLLISNGIKCLEDVSEDNSVKLRLPGCGEWHVRRWIRQATLLRSGRKCIEILDQDKMTFLEEGHFVTWDIETDLAQSCIWLIGAYDTLTGEMKQFFSPADEKACIEEFAGWMAERPGALPVSYSGSRFDSRVLSKSLARHGVVDRSSMCERDVDLGAKLLYSCVHTFSSARLKDLAHELGFEFRHPGLDGMSVGLMFSEYLETGRRPRSWKRYLEYNQDDVAATTLILNHLNSSGRYE
jgi:Icc-related predicted phosphoesterase/uncharacterized protein YprB with RNaseH-like and TPR domain